MKWKRKQEAGRHLVFSHSRHGEVRRGGGGGSLLGCLCSVVRDSVCVPIASQRVPARPSASQPVPARPIASQPVPARPNPLLGPPALPSAPLPHLSFLDVFHSSRPTITRFTRINIHQSSLHIAQGVCVDSCRLQFRTKEAEEFPSGRRRRSGVWSTDSWWFPHSLRSVLDQY